MAALGALRQVPGTLRRNPVLFAPVLVLVVIQLPALALQRTDPLLSTVVSFLVSLVSLVVVPFVHAGLVGMVDEGLDGRTSLDTFRRSGREYYVSTIAATVLVVLLALALAILALLGTLLGFVVLLATGNDAGHLFLLGASLSLLAFVGFLAALFFVQFFAQAIVVDGCDAVGGLERSVSLVRAHLRSALGYSLFVGAGWGVVALVFVGTTLLLAPPVSAGLDAPFRMSQGRPDLLALVTLVGTLAGGVYATYSVAFYRALRDWS